VSAGRYLIRVRLHGGPVVLITASTPALGLDPDGRTYTVAGQTFKWSQTREVELCDTAGGRQVSRSSSRS
jgi:hypothetical protein